MVREANGCLVGLDIIAGCTQFPTDRSPGPDRELLGIDSSPPDDIAVQLGPGCANGSMQAVVGLCQPTV